MKCTRCQQVISFNQWREYGSCLPAEQDPDSEPLSHQANSQAHIRDAYYAMLTEAAYARAQQ